MKTWEDCTLEEQIERWEQCQRVLEGLDEHKRTKHWNMGEWGLDTECGTVACAAGHCGLDPWFIERGLELIRIGAGTRTLGAMSFRDTWACLSYSNMPVIDFFGYQGADLIFHNVRPRPVEDVIEEVKHYIRHLRGFETYPWIR